jgi:hypothetical protein
MQQQQEHEHGGHDGSRWSDDGQAHRHDRSRWRSHHGKAR